MSPYAWHSDGGYYTPHASAYMVRDAGVWRVLLSLPHVAFGRVYPALTSFAAFDDFGDLVLVADADGQVVLQ